MYKSIFIIYMNTALISKLQYRININFRIYQYNVAKRAEMIKRQKSAIRL